MAARTPTKLFSQSSSGLKVYLGLVPNVTTSDTVDLGSTGSNEITKCYLALCVPISNAALAVTTLTNATNLTISTASLTGETCILLVFGATT